MVLNARDWREWRDWRARAPQLPVIPDVARAVITVQQRGTDLFEATVNVRPGAPASWSAYWTVTENAHRTWVHAGENAGESLRNDHVVRQYALVGQYRSDPGTAQILVLHTVPAVSGHDRTVNLVVFDPRNGHTVQALASPC